jgi:hypothetical protein
MIVANRGNIIMHNVTCIACGALVEEGIVKDCMGTGRVDLDCPGHPDQWALRHFMDPHRAYNLRSAVDRMAIRAAIERRIRACGQHFAILREDDADRIVVGRRRQSYLAALDVLDRYEPVRVNYGRTLEP